MHRFLSCWAAVLIVAAALGGCKRDEPVDLVVTSPHKEHIEEEFETAFAAWHEATYGRPVKIQWRNIGGTTQITGYIKAQYAKSDSCGIDVFFGGGAPDHNSLAARGLLSPVVLPPETAAQVPEMIGGVRQRDAQGRWCAACVSSFGILCNAKLLEQKGLPAPTRWADLAAPRMLGLVTAAGPKSGSGRATYEMMLQSAPSWPAGWRRLLSFWGNCKGFTQGASDVPNQVADGEVVAGTCIDYYAFDAIARHTPGLLAFSLPTGSEVFTPDPISVLKGAPHPEMARRFVEFVLSPAGQALWCLPAGAPGGPVKQALGRQPIRKDVYTAQKGRMLKDLVNIYGLSLTMELDEKIQAARVTYILPRLMRTAAVDNAEYLRRARRILVAKGEPADLMEAFCALPPNLASERALLLTAEKIAELERAGDAKGVEAIESAWRNFWREKYQAIIAAE